MKKYYYVLQKKVLRKVTTIWAILIFFILISGSSLSVIANLEIEEPTLGKYSINDDTNHIAGLTSSDLKYDCTIENNQYNSEIGKIKNIEPFSDMMYGYAVSNGPQGEGTYKFDIEYPGEFDYIGGDTVEDYLSGGTYVCEKWLAVEYQYGTLYEIDIETGNLTEIGGGGTSLNGLAIDPTTLILYGCSSDELFIIDPDTGEQELVGPFETGQNHTAIAFTSDGDCYSWDVKFTGDSYLYMVNKETGEASEIGSMGVTLNGPQDGCVSWIDDTLFLTARIISPVDGSYLCIVDLETGELDIIGMLDNNCSLTASMVPNIIFCLYDVGLKNILEPIDGAASKYINVTPQVKNFGYSANDISVTVKIFKENGIEDYNQTVLVDLDWDETLNVEMPPWTPEDWQNTNNKKINYTIYAYTSYFWDDNSSNDYKEKSFELYYGYFHDVGCIDIYGPETGPAQTFPVNSTIKNFGQYEECCFKTHFNIAERNIDTQTELLEQDFSESEFPPLNWTTSHEDWMYSETNYSGGSIGEARLYYQPTTYDIFRLNSPQLDTSEYDLIEIEFKHYLNHSGCVYKIEVDTSQDGENWSSVWEKYAFGDIGPETITIYTLENLGPTTYLSWALNGSCLNVNNWYLDDIVIIGYKTLDPEYVDYSCISKIEPGEEVEFEFDDWTPEFLEEEQSAKIVYLCKSWTNMLDPLDENPANDLVSNLIELEYIHDVGIKDIMDHEEESDIFESDLKRRSEIPFPDTYIAPTSLEINTTIENIGTFPEFNLNCSVKIYEFITNYSQGTLVYEDFIPNIDLEEPLGGSQFLEFDYFNFDVEGVYGVYADLPLETDDYLDNNHGDLIIGVDDTPPIVEIEIDPSEPDGNNGWYITPPNITIIAHDPEIAPGIPGSGVGTIHYSISGEPWETINSDYHEFSVNQNGEINIQFYACDKVGNCASIGSIVIYIDMVKPEIEEVEWEAFKEGFKWYIKFTCYAVDALSGMNRVEMYIDDELFQTENHSGPKYEFTIPWNKEYKEVVFTFYHYDNAGNCAIDDIEGSNIESHSKSEIFCRLSQYYLLKKLLQRYSLLKAAQVEQFNIELETVEHKDTLGTTNISGPSYGRPGIEYIFCVEFTDPEGDDFYIYWDWGDGNMEEWLGPYGSGETICLSHVWSDEGLYLIKVKIKDIYGNESEWYTHEILIEAKLPYLELNRPKRAIYINDRWIAPFIVPIIIGDIQLWFWAEDNESGLNHVELYIDDEFRESFDVCPKSWYWNESLFFKHEIKLVAYDNADNNITKTRQVWKLF